MKDLKAERLHYSQSLKESLEKAVALLSRLNEVEKVSLVGSFSRGQADLFTDLDIVVIMKTDRGMLERLRTLYPMLNLPVDYDLFCYTPHEIKECRNRPFFKRLMSNEVVLYEKKRSRRRIEMAESGL